MCQYTAFQLLPLLAWQTTFSCKLSLGAALASQISIAHQSIHHGFGPDQELWPLQATNSQLEQLQAELDELKFIRQQPEYGLAVAERQNTVGEGFLSVSIPVSMGWSFSSLFIDATLCCKFASKRM